MNEKKLIEKLERTCKGRVTVNKTNNHVIINYHGKQIEYYIRNNNKKLGSNCYIFNFGLALNCPCKELGLCNLGLNGTCYACKSERQYKNTRNARTKQGLALDFIEKHGLYKEFVLGLLKLSKGRSKQNIKYLRLNESSDIRTEKDIIFIEKISKLLKLVNIPVIVYTHRQDLNLTKVDDNIIINYSEYYHKNNKNHNHIIVVNDNSELKEKIRNLKELKLSNYCLCCGSCIECKHKNCFKNDNNIIFFKKH